MAKGDCMTNLIKSSVLMALILSWLAAAASAIESRQVWDTGEMILVFDLRIQPLADEVHRHYPSVKQELELTFGWPLKYKPTVILIPDKGEFQRIVPNPLFIAVAIPSQNTIVIDTSRIQTPPHNLRITLAHELAHLLLHQHIQSVHLPRWLDEGVCQWFTGGVAEILFDRDRPMLGRALGSGEIIGLSEISRRFPSEPRSLMLAYEQSRDIVTLIANRYGGENLIGILNRLRAGDNIGNSIQAQLGISQEELEKFWQRKLTGGVIWWGRVATHLYSILFFLAALLTVAGFWVRRLRRKKMPEDDEAPEAAD